MTTHVVDTLIIGCGPAGTSTALHLCQLDPSWSSRILMLDRARHPRDKLCGGILSFFALDVLARLELPLDTPSVPIANAVFKCFDTGFLLKGEGIFKVVRRSEFDARLLRECESRGIAVSQDEEVLHVQPRHSDVLVTTSRRTLRARTVVAADGTTGITRRLLFPNDRPRLCRLLETLIPVDPDSSWEFRHSAIYSDWSPIAHGIQGYYWEAPSLVNGRPMLNCGLFDSRSIPRHSSVSMKTEFERILASRGFDLKNLKLQGFPIRQLDRHAPLSTDRVLFVGDAAGADPLAGEGISFALGCGRTAAAEISNAFARDNFSFANYRKRLDRDPLFRHLMFRVHLTRLSYLSTNPQFFQWAIKMALLCVVKWSNYRTENGLRPQVCFSPHFQGAVKEKIEPFLHPPRDSENSDQGKPGQHLSSRL